MAGLLTWCLAACDQPPASQVPATERASSCDLNRSPCTIATQWGTLSLSLTPRPAPALKPITVQARFESANAASLTVDLAGAEMDMGPNMISLQRLDEKTMAGTLVIPICITGTMLWRLRLQIREGARQESFAWTFAAPLGEQH